MMLNVTMQSKPKFLLFGDEGWCVWGGSWGGGAFLPVSLSCTAFISTVLCLFGVCVNSDPIIPGLFTNGTAKICCLGLILALLYSTMVIKNDFG